MNNKNYVDEYIKSIKKRQTRAEKIISNDDYLEWLVAFIQSLEHNRFCDDTWLYSPEKISKENHKNINNLNLLVDICINKARENFIKVYAHDSFCGEEVYVKYKDFYLFIGTISGQGTFSFAELLDDVPEKEYIEWELVKSEEISDIAKEKSKTLEEIKNTIINTINSGIEKGIDIEYIEEIIKDIMK